MADPNWRYDAKTKTYYKYENGDWVAKPRPAMTAPDKTALNQLAAEARSADEVQRLYQNVGGALKRFKPNPFKAAFYDAALPEEKGGFWDRLGGVVVGTPAKMLGAITPQSQQDFQLIKSQQSERTAERQVAQKGVQTEADAARYMLADVSPYKNTEVNDQVISMGGQKAARAKLRANFMIQWANKYGLNGVDANGRTGEAAFQELLAQQPTNGGSAAGWSIKRK